MRFRPAEVRETPASPPSPGTRGPDGKRAPRLATPEERAIAVPMEEETPGPGECVVTTMLFGLAGIGFIVGAIPEGSRLLARGLVVQSLTLIGFVVLGITLLLAARIGWRQGMAKAIWPRAVLGLGAMLVLSIAEDLLKGGSIMAYRGHAMMVLVALGPWLAVWLSRAGDARDESADREA